MRAIWKYPIAPDRTTEIVMPQGGRVVHAAMQRGVPHIWVEVLDDAEAVTRRFTLIATGERIPEEVGPHVASFVVDGAHAVLHLYELWPGDAAGPPG